MFTAKFFVDSILPDIAAAKPACKPYRRPILHTDDASPHHAVLTAQKRERSGIVASPQPASSPNLAPSDFFLFRALKGRLAGRTLESADELVEKICQMRSAILQAKLEIIFLKWEERLQWCIDINGADIH
jgi:hypothetical protein